MLFSDPDELGRDDEFPEKKILMWFMTSDIFVNVVVVEDCGDV